MAKAVGIVDDSSALRTVVRIALTCAGYDGIEASDGRDLLAIILTGMGDDGALGMKQLHDLGTHTIAQAEASCVVLGLPGEAIALGVVDDAMPINQVARAILAGPHHPGV